VHADHRRRILQLQPDHRQVHRHGEARPPAPYQPSTAPCPSSWQGCPGYHTPHQKRTPPKKRKVIRKAVTSHKAKASGCGFLGLHCVAHVVGKAASVVGNATGVTNLVNCVSHPGSGLTPRGSCSSAQPLERSGALSTAVASRPASTSAGGSRRAPAAC
jgi:hypothetical protein